MIEFTCPQCGKQHRAKDTAAGKTGKCSCGNRITVPKPGAELALDDDELAVQDDDDELAVQDDDEDIADAASAPGVSDPPDQAFAGDHYDDEPGMRPLTYGLMAAAGLAFLVLAYYTLFCLDAYKSYKRTKTAIELHNKALELLGKNDREAYDAFRKCGKLKPEWTECFLRAAVLSRKVDREHASQRFQEVIEHSHSAGDKAWAYRALAAIALQAEKPDLLKVRQYCKRALKLDRSKLSPRLLLAILDFNQGLYSESAERLRGLEPLGKHLPPQQVPAYWRLRAMLAARERRTGEFLRCALRPAVRGAPAFRRYAACTAFNFLVKRGRIDLERKEDADLWRLASQVPALLREGEARKQAYITLCCAVYNAGNDEKAASFIEQVIGKQDPPSLLMYALTGSLVRLALGGDAAPGRGATAGGEQQDKEGAGAEAGKREAPKKQTGKHEPDDKATAGKRKRYAELAIGFLRRMVADKVFLHKRGAGLLSLALAFADRMGDSAAAAAFLTTGLHEFPREATLQRRCGFLLLKAGKYTQGVERLERALALDPGQKDLRREIAIYRAPPRFDQFRPAKPNEFKPRPLIHVRARSSTPKPLVAGSVRMLLDGKPVDCKRGGDELFYVPERDLAAGMHTLVVEATDALGNKGRGTYKFPVDRTPPFARLRAPRGGTSVLPRPLLKLELLDEYSKVDPYTVSIVLKNGKGNPYYCNTHILKNGTWRINDEKLGIKSGEPLTNPERVSFHPPRALKPGDYLLLIRMRDYMEQAANLQVEFSIQ